MGVVKCGMNEFFDKPTQSCTDCAVICENMDIQGTRQQCVTLCPDSPYLTTTTATTTVSTALTTTQTIPVFVTTNSGVIAIVVLLALLVLLAASALLFYHKKKLVTMIKTRDCCGEETTQVHAQETSTHLDQQRPETHNLLPVGQEAFPDLPGRIYDVSSSFSLEN